MSGKTGIEWTDRTWNPVVGCTHVSAGCDHCYAATLHNRRYLAWQRGTFPTAPPQYHKPFWTGPAHVQMMPERLPDPLHWRKPQRIFVNSVSDLFHEDVPFTFIDRVFAVMARAPQHTFQILTKRPARMCAYLAEWKPSGWRINGNSYECITRDTTETDGTLLGPLPNVWLGTSVEDQATADERIPLLLQTPAAVRFLSCEPLLGALDLTDVHYDDMVAINALTGEYGFPTPHAGPDRRIDWVIVGGESGSHARPMGAGYAQSLVDQCRVAHVPVFVKQLGEVWARAYHTRERHAGDPEEWPGDLRVREFPQTTQDAVEAAR